MVFYIEKACEFLNLPQLRINLPLLFEHQAVKLFRVPYSDSMHKANACILATIESFLSTQNSSRLDLMQNLRVRFPPNSSRTDRIEVFGPIDWLRPLH